MNTAQSKNPKLWNSAKLMFLIVLLSQFLTYCEKKDDPIDPVKKDKGTYSLKTKYSLIRSYPLGGGIFIVYMEPNTDFSGKVNLQLDADSSLNAKLSAVYLDNTSRVAEITIRPKGNVEIKQFPITLRAEHAGETKTLTLQVDMFDWTNTSPEYPLSKRDEFKDWALAQDPKYNSIFSSHEQFYYTYPEIVIIEHFTYLTDEYEVRFCYSVMAPSYDWSMIMIRKRGSVKAEIAARKEMDGRIFTIPVEDYPLTLNY